jgi:hypothetical protein
MSSFVSSPPFFFYYFFHSAFCYILQPTDLAIIRFSESAQFPALVYLDPHLLKLLLEPLFKYSQSGLYPNRW